MRESNPRYIVQKSVSLTTKPTGLSKLFRHPFFRHYCHIPGPVEHPHFYIDTLLYIKIIIFSEVKLPKREIHVPNTIITDFLVIRKNQQATNRKL